MMNERSKKHDDNCPFNYVSLFAGIGGFDTALNELEGCCVMASEIDKFARKAYETLYGVEPKGDITKIRSEDIPEHDLLTAGFPCQAFSVAGKRAGMAYVCNDCAEEQTLSFNDYADRKFICEKCGGHIKPVDGRGLLFFEVARVARDKQPKMLLLENVKGLVGHDKGRTLDTIVKTLNSIGYTIDFEVLNTKYFGLPQDRERIFIVAYRDDLIEATGWSAESRKGNTVVPKGKRRLHSYNNVKTFDFPFPKNDTVTSCLMDVLETEVEERYYLDDEKTAGVIKKLEGASEWMTNTPIASDVERAVVNSLPMDCEIHQEPKIKVVGSLEGTHESGNRVYSKNGLAPTIAARDYKGPKMIADEIIEVGKLNMKGHRSVRAVHSPYGQCPTLTTMGGGHREPKTVEFVGKQHRIRKLMPLECWRLQGFTDEQHNAVEKAGISNTQRYKQAGNAVSVPVITAIVKNMLVLLNDKANHHRSCDHTRATENFLHSR